jgi:hypothetical protein
MKLIGDTKHLMPQDCVDESWRVMPPAVEAPTPALPHERGSWVAS